LGSAGAALPAATHLETLDLAALANLAEATGKPKLRRAAARVAALAEAELADYVTL
jgi:hypothetical protein